MAQKSPTSRTADEVAGKILKRDADLLVALIGGVLKTNSLQVLVEALMRSCQANAQQNFESHWLAVNLCRLEQPVL